MAGVKLPPTFINPELAVIVPVVILPVTFSVPFPEKVIVFVMALFPMATLPFTVNVPVAMVTAQILALFPEFDDDNPVQITLPFPARLKVFVTFPVGGFMVILPAFKVIPVAIFKLVAVLLLFELIIILPLVQAALIFTVVPAFKLNAALETGAPADHVPPAQAPL